MPVQTGKISLNANGGVLLYSTGGNGQFAVGSLESPSTSSQLVADFGNAAVPGGSKWLYLSPDRQSIAVTVNPVGTDVPPSTYITDIRGTPRTSIHEGAFVSWAPDSSKVLLYVSPTESPWTRQIYALDFQDKYYDTGLPDGTISADISPVDGSILYSVTSGGTDASTIYVRDPQGNDKLLVEGNGSILAWIRWSPTGGKFAFMKSNLAIDSGDQSVWVGNPDGTGAEKVSNIGWNYPPAWSHDGTKFTFSSSGDIWEYDAGQKSLRNVTEGKGGSRPNYSSDGKTIVFSSTVSGESQIWAVTGGNLLQLTHGSADKDYPILP